jgi:ketosteroid isomerase-like protein
MAKKIAPKKTAPKKAPKAARKAAAQRPAAKAASAADAIRRLDAVFMKAAGARDAGALVKGFYAPSAVLMPPNHPAVEGSEAIRGFLQGLMDSGLASLKLETATTASAGDLAYGRGRYTLSMTPAGGAPVQDEGKYIVVYRRQPDGAWRAVADIFNSNQAAQ